LGRAVYPRALNATQSWAEPSGVAGAAAPRWGAKATLSCQYHLR
jgi:hypothetical protein